MGISSTTSLTSRRHWQSLALEAVTDSTWRTSQRCARTQWMQSCWRTRWEPFSIDSKCSSRMSSMAYSVQYLLENIMKKPFATITPPFPHVSLSFTKEIDAINNGLQDITNRLSVRKSVNRAALTGATAAAEIQRTKYSSRRWTAFRINRHLSLRIPHLDHDWGKRDYIESMEMGCTEGLFMPTKITPTLSRYERE